MPSRFLNNVNINDSYTLPAADGTAEQIISTDGAGQLSFIDQKEITAGSATVVTIECKNTHTTPLTKGTPVYQTGTVGATDVIEIAPGNALISTGAQPSIGLLQQDLAINEFGYVIITGELLNITTDPIDGLTPVTGQKVFVKSGGGLTLTKPTTELNSIQNMGLVGKVSGGNAGSITVSSIMRTNDVPNLPTGKIWVGEGNTIVSDTVYLDEVNNRMGIGTTSPAAKLQVNTGSDINAQFGIDDAGSFKLGDITNNYTGRGVFYSGSPGSEDLQVSTNTFRISGNGGAGIQTVANGDVYLNTQSGVLATLDSSTNNFGIGTTTPSGKLEVRQAANNGDTGAFTNTHVKLTASATADNTGFVGITTATSTADNYGYSFGAQRTSGGVGDFKINYHNNSAAGVNRFIIDQGGNVGIGTDNPTNELTIESATPVIDIKSTNSFPSSKISFLNSGGNEFSAIQAVNNPFTSAFTLKYVTPGLLSLSSSLQLQGGNLFLSTANSEKMRITSTGNVGIGTTSPNAKLEVAGSTRITGTGLDVGYGNNGTNYVQVGSGRTTNGYALLDLIGDSTYTDYGFRILRNNGGPNTDTDILHRGTGDLDLKTLEAGDIGFHTTSIQRMIVKSDGDVGIGTTLPQSKLQVNGGVQLANDTASPSASKVGTFRYRTSGNNSYVDMCMQTGASTYAWVNIVQNTW